MYQLLRLAGLLDALPLPPGSAQADMVAAGIANRATLPEREVRNLCCSVLCTRHALLCTMHCNWCTCALVQSRGLQNVLLPC